MINPSVSNLPTSPPSRSESRIAFHFVSEEIPAANDPNSRSIAGTATLASPSLMVQRKDDATKLSTENSSTLSPPTHGHNKRSSSVTLSQRRRKDSHTHTTLASSVQQRYSEIGSKGNKLAANRLSSLPPLWKDKDMYRFYFYIALQVAYFVAQITFSIIASSLALQAEALHNLTDIMAVLFAAAATRMSKYSATPTRSFGYSRMEVIGGMVNAVFLFAVCLTVIAEAIQRMTEAPNQDLLDNSLYIAYVSGVGVVVNLIGLFVFLGHESGHSHSHGLGHSHGHAKTTDKKNHQHQEQQRQIDENAAEDDRLAEDSEGVHAIKMKPVSGSDASSGHSHAQKLHSARQPMNLAVAAIILHVAGDAVGSLAAVGSGLFIHFTSYYYRYFADPLSSLLITTLIISQCIPLFRRSAHILLQFVPSSINTRKVIQQLQKVDGHILDIHDFHVYQLNSKKTVATLHVRLCSNMAEKWNEICDELKLVLHKHKLHASCIQPEFDNSPNNCPQCAVLTRIAVTSVVTGTTSPTPATELDEEKQKLKGVEETVVDSRSLESSALSGGKRVSELSILDDFGPSSSCWDVVCDDGKGECKKQQCCEGEMIRFAD